MVKTASFHCRGHGFDPGQGTKILHTVQPKKKKKKKKKKKQKAGSFSLESLSSGSALQSQNFELPMN